MKVMLIFPPQSQPFLPHLATPLLSAVLKKEGIEVVQKDFNLESYEYFLSADYLEKMGISKNEASKIEDIKNNIRTGEDYFVPKDYFDNILKIQDYIENAAKQYNGTIFNLKTFRINSYITSAWKDIYNATFDRQSNLFIDFFEKKIEDIAYEKPDLIGISISWDSQIIPAFTLSRLIKKHLPHIHVCMGGSMISHLADYLKYKRKIFAIVDSFIPFDGEIGLVKLAKSIKSKKFKDVPGLIYPVKKKVKFNKPQMCQNIGDIPTPNFDGLFLEKYYSPQSYLPIFASRGCYWAKCSFCSHHFSGSSFRARTAEAVFEEMNLLYNKYKCKNFYFVDDTLPPALALKLSHMIFENNKPYRWVAEIRFEDVMDGEYFNDLYAGGCRLLLFGLEAASQRVLDLMHKGIKRENAKKLLSLASNAGIITWTFFFFGFPGEKESEAKETIKFLIENRKNIDMVAGGYFILTRNSEVFENLEKFHIKAIYDDKEQDLQIAFPCLIDEGISKDEAKAFLREFQSCEESEKFLEYFVAEPHLLFFKKSYFQSKV